MNKTDNIFAELSREEFAELSSVLADAVTDIGRVIGFLLTLMNGTELPGDWHIEYDRMQDELASLHSVVLKEQRAVRYGNVS